MSYAPELAAAPSVDRYEIQSLLGRGASSIVYLAFDRTMNLQVALKSLRFVEQEDIYELKKEFRYFRDVHHPHLVKLFDLHVEPEACFFTMELVDGVNFVEKFAAVRQMSGEKTPDQSDYEQLRECVNQFGSGLAALHASGRLHRDVKPSNVLVDSGPRTVLLDFGLAIDVKPSETFATRSRFYAGTPGYLAPERLAGERASEASDVYGLGLVLYETLTGERPFAREKPLMEYEAQKSPPVPAKERLAGVPSDLSDLAQSLLAFDPGQRPSLHEIISKTRSGTGAEIVDANLWHPSLQHGYFVGRDAELAQFADAMALCRSGGSAIVELSGVSGIGKSSLVERFAETARKDDEALVLRSRCHHREFVRNNALDGLIDVLTRYLLLQEEDLLKAICPPTLPALISVFPVLARVQFPYDTIDASEVFSDPIEIVDQASNALCTLLSRLGKYRPVVIWIDDLQWSDNSSFSILMRILASRDCRNVLTILSYRTDAADNLGITGFRDSVSNDDKKFRIWNIELKPLTRQEVKTLLQLIGGSTAQGSENWLDQIELDTDGLPYFVAEYANYWRKNRKHGPESEPAGDGVSNIIGKRLSELSPRQVAVLELVAISGAPISETLLVRLAEEANATGQEIYDLIDLRLLRKGASHDSSAIEAYHDRIRQAVLAEIPTTRAKSWHLTIARGMAKSKEPDLARLVEHFLGGEDFDMAARYAVDAARASVLRLAFDDAANYLQLALHYRDWGSERLDLIVEHAETLAKAGLSAEAAEQYLVAVNMLRVSGSNPTRMSLLHAKAATELLHSGQLVRGRDACRLVFEDLGLPFPETLQQAKRASIFNRFVLSVSYTRKTQNPDQLARTNTLWEAAAGLIMMDFVIGDAVFSWYLREVAKLDDPINKLRADVCSATGFANLGSNWAQSKATKLLQQSDRLHQTIAEPMAKVLLGSGKSGVAWFSGKWSEAAEYAGDASNLSRREVAQYDFINSILHGYRLSALICLGELQTARTELEKVMVDGKRRGDNFISRIFPTGFGAFLDLANDDVRAAISKADAVLTEAPDDRFSSLHWAHFNGKGNAHIYANEVEEVFELLDAQWPLIERTGFLRLACIASILLDIRARAALKAIVSRKHGRNCGIPENETLISIANECAVKIRKFKILPFSEALALVIEAVLADQAGNKYEAENLLHAAKKGFEQSNMKLHEASVARMLTERFGGTDAATIEKARRIFEEQQIKDVDRFASMMCPIQ